MRNPPRFPLLPLALVVLAGCGGGGGGHHTSATSATSLKFSNASSDYNGLTTTLTGTAQSDGINTGVNIILNTGDRYFEIVVNYDQIKDGNQLPLRTGSDGAIAIYSEGEDSSKTWQATAGTVTFSNVSGYNATVTLSGATFSPSNAFGTTTGIGTFEINGNVVTKAIQTGND